MLSLPWRLAAPAQAVFVVLHWLVSASVFLVQTAGYSSGGPDEARRLHGADASRVGFSPGAILLAVGVGGAVLGGLVGNGFRRYDGGGAPRGLVSVVTRSAGISALCRPSSEDGEAWLFPVSLGVVRGDGGGGGERLTFSSDVDARRPVEGWEVRLPIPRKSRDSPGGRGRRIRRWGEITKFSFFPFTSYRRSPVTRPTC